ncbi:50S ribosomal protein L6 [Candidatus Gottesmanbacteria bacterium]|nr:50S ribosomal protein L6 [Candidatus Gottesmanbacteria bacterium]
MSRIGNAVISMEKGVTVLSEKGKVTVGGPKGQLVVLMPAGVDVQVRDSEIHVHTNGSDDALHGFARAVLANAITGVTSGWTRTLELSGVGYRAAMSGIDLNLSIGFSHPVVVHPVAGITFSIVDGKIVISGVDKQSVGQTAASIRAIKKPEPYKGKGIKYVGEYVRKKAGKSAKAVGGAPGAGGK